VAQDEKSQGILEKLSEKMNESTSFYVEFNVNIKNSATSAEQNETGKEWVKGDNYFALFGDNTVISNGVKNWTIINEEKTIYVTDVEDADDENVNPKKLMTIWENGFKSKYGKETTINGETIHLIYLYPFSPGTVDYHTVILHISKSTGELKNVIINMKDGTIMTYSVSKFTSNPVIDDSKFIFNKGNYPGYIVVQDN
jgi:outer membrane lipoprotein-sorting protein